MIRTVPVTEDELQLPKIFARSVAFDSCVAEELYTLADEVSDVGAFLLETEGLKDADSRVGRREWCTEGVCDANMLFIAKSNDT